MGKELDALFLNMVEHTKRERKSPVCIYLGRNNYRRVEMESAEHALFQTERPMVFGIPVYEVDEDEYIHIV